MEYDYLKIAGRPAIVTGEAGGIGRATAWRWGGLGEGDDLRRPRRLGESAVKEIRDHGGTAGVPPLRRGGPGAGEGTGCGHGGGLRGCGHSGEQRGHRERFPALRGDHGRGLGPDASGGFNRAVLSVPRGDSLHEGQEAREDHQHQPGSGIIGCEFCSHYASAKAGLIGFTQSIAKELGGDHINANAIAVPTTQTPMLKETDFDIFVEDELRDIPWGESGRRRTLRIWCCICPRTPPST